MNKKYWIIIFFVVFQKLIFPVWSDDASGAYARIVSQGRGESTAVPTHVEFQFVHVAQDNNFDLAFKCIQDFETKLRLRFTEESPRPVEIQSVGPLYELKDEPQIEVRVTAIFSLAGIVSVENGAILFAKLWDKMRNLANELSADLKGPYLRVQNEEAVIRSAINSAVENAYSPADAGAGALRGGIFAVEKIEINKIEWENDGRKEGDTVSMTEVRCKSTVTVTYLVSQM
ncbi:MAG: hypothetical protein ACP5UA_02355 [Candidatus Hydrogenedens sp.]